MRHQRLVVLIAVVLLCTTSFTVTGQDEPPLPPVRVRAAVTPPPPLAEEPSFVLPVEPVRSIDYSAPAESLAEAALRNDYAAFHQLYVERPSPTFAPLHEVWSYAMNNPMGAFYGEELHDRLARAYPSYAAYIEDYRLVDDRGQVFYPTAETRRFLTERAVAGATPSARVQVADVGGTTQLNPLVTRRSTPRVETRTETRETTATPRSTTTPATGPSRKRLKKAEVTIPPVKKQEPVQVAAVAVPPAPVAAKTAAPVQTEQPVPAPPKPVQANVLTPSLPVPVETPGATDPMTGRGALLIVIALAGIGVLMLMLRVPREEVPASIIKPEEKPAEPVTPVAPMRKSKRKASA